MVAAIHDERGYRAGPPGAGAAIRRRLAAIPTSRSSMSISPATAASILHHTRAERRVCSTRTTPGRVLQHLADLWGYDVVLKESRSDRATPSLKEHAAGARPLLS